MILANMNLISVTRFCSYCTRVFENRILTQLSEQQRRIAMFVAAVLAIFALSYMVCRAYFFSATKGEKADDQDGADDQISLPVNIAEQEEIKGEPLKKVGREVVDIADVKLEESKNEILDVAMEMEKLEEIQLEPLGPSDTEIALIDKAEQPEEGNIEQVAIEEKDAIELEESFEPFSVNESGVQNIQQLLALIDLHGSRIKELDLKYSINGTQLSQVLNKCPRLNELKLRLSLALEECGFDDPLFDLIAKLPLKTFKVIGHHASYLKRPECFTQLTSLSMLVEYVYEDLTNVGLLSNLTSLSLKWSSEDIHPLLREIAKLTRLESLELVDCLGLMNGEALAVLEPLTRLKSLSLFGCVELKDSAWESIAKLKSLEALDLTDCRSLKLKHVAILSQLDKLHTLRLCCKYISREAIEELKKLRVLKILDLSYCRYESYSKESAIAALVEALPGLKIIQDNDTTPWLSG